MNIVVNVMTGAVRPFADSATSTKLDTDEEIVAVSRLPLFRTERYDSVLEFRPATAQEIADYDAAQTVRQTAAAQVTSRQKDILATIAWAVRRANVTAWNNLTLTQKKSAVLAEADTWRDIRVFIEQNL